MISWKTGFEIELMLPRGSTREQLAQACAAQTGGQVERFFHRQSELSKVPGTPAFENLTFGFRVRDGDGNKVADFVDDITLNRALDRNAAPKGWYRIVSDDARLLRLVVLHCSPTAPLREVLDPLAALFDTKAQHHASGMVKVTDERNVSIALAAPMPGERERPCEIVTPPLTQGHEQVIGSLLKLATDAGCTVPAEAACHIHFDAAPLESTPVFCTLVKVFDTYGDALKRLVRTNPNCTRLGRWPKELLRTVKRDGFVWQPWEVAREELLQLPLSKYCDFNLLNLVHRFKDKTTFEVRILPVELDAARMVAACALFEGMLNWCVSHPAHADKLPDLKPFIAGLPISAEVRDQWLNRP